MLTLTGYANSDAYQWQKKLANGQWEDVAGAIGTSISMRQSSAGGTFRVKVYSDSGCYEVTDEFSVKDGYCYKNPLILSGFEMPTQHGITALNRAGAENGNWPMVRQSGWTALEANTKGFVVNRMPTDKLSEIDAVEGMMVFDTTAQCLKIYNGEAWKCLSAQSCPDNNN